MEEGGGGEAARGDDEAYEAYRWRKRVREEIQQSDEEEERRRQEHRQAQQLQMDRAGRLLRHAHKQIAARDVTVAELQRQIARKERAAARQSRPDRKHGGGRPGG